ncbi:MAG: pro-sigmaK processing inhibitor BofA family protein [Bacilli bacterium]|jgi:inhibitor of the pro-sigma K processing machinery|nr:pro-sigmaK processing inhibitor BofA family protein [Bacilli bacterium]
MKFLKTIKWIIESLLLGLGILFVFNLIGVYINVNIPINIFTILIVGFLRIPGLVAIIIYMLI